ncbi:MAG: AGE family epimerase/isomerase [Spirochaetes bacterium]|nr:AGE family epimerase/isomerase [Spirochaetota bacterium]
MEKERIQDLSEFFYRELIENTLPFWTNCSPDREFGGFFSLIDRDGSLLGGDKYMWIVGRETWLFSKLYNSLEKREEWLELASHGIDFIRKYGFDTDGRMFYLVTKDGRPLRKRRYVLTELFNVMAFAEYAKATGEKRELDTAKKMMDLALGLMKTPGALEPKVNPEVRPMRAHVIPMLSADIFNLLREADPSGDYDGRIKESIDELFLYFVKPEKKAVFEIVSVDGSLLDTPEGRCVNPGHAIETSWFIMEEARRTGDSDLLHKATEILDWSLELGWDKTHGGILYFVDIEGKPTLELQWDMKLWWPHNEAIYATLLAYHLTNDEKYEEWFERILGYVLDHFPDKEQGEWFGYLHRDGTVSNTIKGNGWKGPFHLPRQQLYCHLLLKEML